MRDLSHRGPESWSGKIFNNFILCSNDLDLHDMKKWIQGGYSLDEKYILRHILIIEKNQNIKIPPI